MIKISDKKFKALKVIRLTNKQRRKMDKADGYVYEDFYKAVVEQANKAGIALTFMDPDLVTKVKVTPKYAKELVAVLEKQLKKKYPYMKKGTRHFSTSIGLMVLDHGPCEISHKDAEDDKVYIDA